MADEPPEDQPEEESEQPGQSEEEPEEEISPEELAMEYVEEGDPPAAEESEEPASESSEELEPTEESEEEESPEGAEKADQPEEEQSTEESEETEDTADEPEEEPDQADPTGEGESTEQADEEEEPEGETEDQPAEEETVEEGEEEEEEGIEDLLSEEQDPAAGEEEVESEEPGAEESSGEEDEIREILQEEAERSRVEEDREEEPEEEDLPEGYLSVDELPSAEPQGIPDWFKTTCWALLGVFLVGVFLWYVVLPLWETYHQVQAHRHLDQGEYVQASESIHQGMLFWGLLLRTPDPYLADYLKRLLEKGKLELFEREYEELRAGAYGPRTDQVWAQYELYRGNYQQALDASLRLRTYPSTRLVAYLIGARSRLALGQFDRVPSEIRNAQDLQPGHPAAIRVDRDRALREDQPRQALNLAGQLDQVVDEDEKTGRDFVVLSEIHARLGNPGRAEQMLETALQVEPDSFQARRDVIKRYLFGRQFRSASRWIEGGPGREPFRQRYPQKAVSWWTEAELRLSRGETARPLDLLRRAFALDGQNPETYRVMGKLMLDELEDPSQAVRYLARAREFGLERLPDLHHLARAQYEAGQYQQAIQLLERIRDSVEEPSQDLRYNIAAARVGAGQTDEARESFQDLLEQDYETQNLHAQWGLAHLQDGNIQQAMGRIFQGIERGQRQGADVSTLRDLINQLLEAEDVSVDENLRELVPYPGLQYWQTLSPSEPDRET